MPGRMGLTQIMTAMPTMLHDDVRPFYNTVLTDSPWQQTAIDGPVSQLVQELCDQ